MILQRGAVILPFFVLWILISLIKCFFDCWNIFFNFINQIIERNMRRYFIAIFIVLFSLSVYPQDNDTISTFKSNAVEELPQFPGGENAMYQYISENVNYPELAVESAMQGTVHVEFIIEKNGSISNIEILRGVVTILDEEAKRVIKEMPNWKPGKLDGKPVRVQYTIPIKFSLSSTNNSAYLYFEKGEKKFLNADYKGAIEEFNKSLEIEDHFYTYRYRAKAKAAIKDYKGAIEDAKASFNDENISKEVIKEIKKELKLYEKEYNSQLKK
jgi:TonB family protein